jgi:tight adherence protein C
MTPLVISVFSFICLVLLSLVAVGAVLLRRSGQVWRSRIERAAVASPSPTGVAGLVSQVMAMAVTSLQWVGRSLHGSDQEEANTLRQTLTTAGYRSAQAVWMFYGAKVAGMVTLPLVVWLMQSSSMIEPMKFWHVAMYVICAAIGFYLPAMWLRRAVASRQSQIFEGLPDAIDLMVICIESGLGLVASISRVGEELKLAHPAVSDEFRLVSLELRAGLARQDALRNLGRRTALDDVKSLVAMLIQTDRFGTSVAQAFRVHSEFMRKQRYLKAEELAGKIPVKLMFPLILFVFPNLFIVLLGPGVIQIVRVLLPALSK